MEKDLPLDSSEVYPVVVGGGRMCPWEDSGGPGGYTEKIGILKDKNHESFKETAEWVGVNDFSELDLELFDSDDVIFRNPATEFRRLQK